MVGCAEIRILENQIYQCLSVQQEVQGCTVQIFYSYVCIQKNLQKPGGQNPCGVLGSPRRLVGGRARTQEAWDKNHQEVCLCVPKPQRPSVSCSGGWMCGKRASFPCTQTLLNPCSEPFTSLAFEDLSSLVGCCK